MITDQIGPALRPLAAGASRAGRNPGVLIGDKNASDLNNKKDEKCIKNHLISKIFRIDMLVSKMYKVLSNDLFYS